MGRIARAYEDEGQADPERDARCLYAHGRVTTVHEARTRVVLPAETARAGPSTPERTESCRDVVEADLVRLPQASAATPKIDGQLVGKLEGPTTITDPAKFPKTFARRVLQEVTVGV